MKSQQRLDHSPVATLCQMLERHPGSLAEYAPLLSKKVRDRVVFILDPQAPLAARLLDSVGPVRKATRRPLQAAGWG
jgi:hypothetical protein